MVPATTDIYPYGPPLALPAALPIFPTGVTVITAAPETGPVGMAVGSFCSVSLDPPLVAFFPSHTSSSWPGIQAAGRSEEHTSELQSLMRISYAVFCLKKKKHTYKQQEYSYK